MNLDTPEPVDMESSESEDEGADNDVFASHPGLRNARDLALMAEEKWLIEALKTIKKQRIALKVIHLT